MRKWSIKVASLAVVLFGAVTIFSSQPVQAFECCYSDCMEFCTDSRSFDECHFTCNNDCQAC